MVDKHNNTINIPRKKYFKIGEVAKIFNIESHTLRFWEKQFTQLKPRRNKTSGHRTYTRKDVEVVHVIYNLLYEENFTNKGAQQKLQELFGKERQVVQEQSNNHTQINTEHLLEVREELNALKTLINEL